MSVCYLLDDDSDFLVYSCAGDSAPNSADHAIYDHLGWRLYTSATYTIPKRHPFITDGRLQSALKDVKGTFAHAFQAVYPDFTQQQAAAVPGTDESVSALTADSATHDLNARRV